MLNLVVCSENCRLLYRRQCGSDEWRKTRQWCTWSCHIVNDNLATIESHYVACFRLGICITRIISHWLLSLPRLPQRIVYIGIVIDERMWIGSHAFILTFRILLGEIFKLEISCYGLRTKIELLSHFTCESLELTSDGFSVTLLSSGFSS